MSLNRLAIPFVPAQAGTQFFGRVLGPWIPAFAGMNGDWFNGSANQNSSRLSCDSGPVQGHGGANESLQRLLIYLLALVEVDRTPCVPLQAGVEEARRILQ